MKYFTIIRTDDGGVPRITHTMPGLERSEAPLYTNDVQLLVALIDSLRVGGKITIRRGADT